MAAAIVAIPLAVSGVIAGYFLGESQVALERRFLHELPLTWAGEVGDASPQVVVDGDAVYLAWACRTAEGGHTLNLATSADGGRTLSPPRVVQRTDRVGADGSGGRRPLLGSLRVAARAGTVYLCWMEGGAEPESVRVRFAQSSDGARTFSDAVSVHEAATCKASRLSLGVAVDGTVVCAWLDGRNGAPQPFAAVRWAGANAFGVEQLVYAGRDGGGVCENCPTDALVTSDGDVLVAYRAADLGFRDPVISRTQPGRFVFDAPRAVLLRPTWKLASCPQDGPAMAEDGRGLHVVWVDGSDGTRRVHHGRSGGFAELSFETSRPVATEGGPAQAHPDVAASGDDVHLVWEQAFDADQAAGRGVAYCGSRDGGDTFGPVVALAHDADVFRSRPRVAALDDGALCVVWTELVGDARSIVLLRVDAPSTEGSP